MILQATLSADNTSPKPAAGGPPAAAQAKGSNGHSAAAGSAAVALHTNASSSALKNTGNAHGNGSSGQSEQVGYQDTSAERQCAPALQCGALKAVLPCILLTCRLALWALPRSRACALATTIHATAAPLTTRTATAMLTRPARIREAAAMTKGAPTTAAEAAATRAQVTNLPCLYPIQHSNSRHT